MVFQPSIFRCENVSLRDNSLKLPAILPPGFERNKHVVFDSQGTCVNGRIFFVSISLISLFTSLVNIKYGWLFKQQSGHLSLEHILCHKHLNKKNTGQFSYQVDWENQSVNMNYILGWRYDDTPINIDNFRHSICSQHWRQKNTLELCQSTVFLLHIFKKGMWKIGTLEPFEAKQNIYSNNLSWEMRWLVNKASQNVPGDSKWPFYSWRSQETF